MLQTILQTSNFKQVLQMWVWLIDCTRSSFTSRIIRSLYWQGILGNVQLPWAVYQEVLSSTTSKTVSRRHTAEISSDLADYENDDTVRQYQAGYPTAINHILDCGGGCATRFDTQHISWAIRLYSILVEVLNARWGIEQAKSWCERNRASRNCCWRYQSATSNQRQAYSCHHDVSRFLEKDTAPRATRLVTLAFGTEPYEWGEFITI